MPLDLKNLVFPVRYMYGEIVDGNGKILLKAERENSKTPLLPYERDLLLKIVADLLNQASQNGDIEFLTDLHT